MQSFLNVITLQTYTFFTTLTPRLHGRSKRFFRRPQNLNAPRILGYSESLYKIQINHINIKRSECGPDHSFPSNVQEIYTYFCPSPQVLVALHSNLGTSVSLCLFLSPFKSLEAQNFVFRHGCQLVVHRIPICSSPVMCAFRVIRHTQHCLCHVPVGNDYMQRIAFVLVNMW